ncbi:hypothetical protein MP638_006900 [Amoeboaphelidium occidentale]|nr:hypothetical protein MP638_006900 [Amoeboaphelidium occidentale]
MGFDGVCGYFHATSSRIQPNQIDSCCMFLVDLALQNILIKIMNSSIKNIILLLVSFTSASYAQTTHQDQTSGVSNTHNPIPLAVQSPVSLASAGANASDSNAAASSAVGIASTQAKVAINAVPSANQDQAQTENINAAAQQPTPAMTSTQQITPSPSPQPEQKAEIQTASTLSGTVSAASLNAAPIQSHNKVGSQDTTMYSTASVQRQQSQQQDQPVAVQQTQQQQAAAVPPPPLQAAQERPEMKTTESSIPTEAVPALPIEPKMPSTPPETGHAVSTSSKEAQTESTERDLPKDTDEGNMVMKAQSDEPAPPPPPPVSPETPQATTELEYSNSSDASAPSNDSDPPPLVLAQSDATQIYPSQNAGHMEKSGAIYQFVVIVASFFPFLF